MNGVIKKKMDGKNFGFITPEGQDKDVFFHESALVGITFAEIQEGTKVTFDIEDSPKGDGRKNAANVTPVN